MPILEWNAGRFEKLMADKVEHGMEKATAYVAQQAFRSLSRGNLQGDDPSLPGEPPKTVSGKLKTHIRTQVVREPDSIAGYVGVTENVAYARRLELGFVGTDSLGRTIDQAPRPFLRPALLRSRDKIVELIAKG